MTLTDLAPSLPLLAFAFFAFKRLLTYLHIFQQEEYDGTRFLRWLGSSRAYDRRVTIGMFVLYFVGMMMVQTMGTTGLWGFKHPVFAAGLALLFIMAGLLEADPRLTGKKKLAMTQRAKRILGVSAALLLLVTLLVVLMPQALLPWLIGVHAIPFMLVLATKLLSPYDNAVNAKFRAEAVEILHKTNPFVIGITGSFGKTSVKHILGHILNTHAPTLITPGSVNTEMGITRIIREQLTTRHKYFVVEMGAYGIGSIAKLCAFTPPKLSLLTAIGAAHYERFKTLEDTAQAKFEIAQSAKAQGGKTVIPAQALKPEYARSYFNANRADFICCDTNKAQGDVVLNSAKQTPDGLLLSISAAKHDHQFTVPLYGIHHGMNVTLAFAAALELGLPADDIITALQSVPQITHRLEVKRSGNQTTIDDAYNSNPDGFTSALNLLHMLKTHQNGRGILVTPGMVELGAAHDTEHAKLGALAAEKADIVLAVVPQRIPTFVEAAQNGAQVIPVASFSEAQAWMQANLRGNDVVLLENDLPDLFEKKLRL